MLLALALAAAAQADPGPTAPPAAFELSAEATLLSDYRFRGVSRSDGDPTLQAALTLSHDSGLYVGARVTPLAGNDPWRLRAPNFTRQGDAEVDLYAGYGRELGAGFSVDGGVMYYAFAGGRRAADYAEPYASLSYALGPAQLTAGAKYAPPQAGTGRQDMTYVFGRLDLSVPFSPWSFSAGAGRQDWGRYGSYRNWSLGARYHLRIPRLAGAELGLTYIDTDLPSRHGQDATVQASLGVRF